MSLRPLSSHAPWTLGAGAAVLLLLPGNERRSIAQEPAFVVRVIDEGAATSACADPARFPNPVPDLDRMPQAEVALDVAEDGRVAAAAKDFRYSSPATTAYNAGVWNGLYLSEDRGASWRNLMFQDRDPNHPLTVETGADLGQQAGLPVAFDHETDPVVAFDSEGAIYTSGLVFADGAGNPSGIVFSRRDRDGRIVPGAVHLFGVEADTRLFDDKNWMVVERGQPTASTLVVQTWRLFTSGPTPPAAPGGWITASADGGASFTPPRRLPVPPADAAGSQFYQPVLGPDPVTGRKTLYVFFRDTDATETARLNLHLLKADLGDLAPGTAALAERLSRSETWSYLPRRFTNLTPYSREGWDAGFRVASFFYPALDLATGTLWVAAHVSPRPGALPQVLVSRSTDGGLDWSALHAVDKAAGAQVLPAVAARGGLASVLWYDTRHAPAMPGAPPLQAIDVYYAEIDEGLGVRRVLRLTPQTEAVDRPAFTRLRGAPSALAAGGLRPHDVLFPGPPEGAPATASSAQACSDDRYGFLGDYLGLAVDAEAAYAAWADVRDQTSGPDVCAGHTCEGNRNLGIYFARIPR